MSRRNVSKDELIAVWLQREFEGNWNRYIREIAAVICPSLTKDQCLRIVSNPNYQNVEENYLRFRFAEFRYPLLQPICVGNWYEENLSLDDFKSLRVIARDPSWIVLSNNTGELSVVAECIFNSSIRNPTPDTHNIIDAVNIIRENGIDKRLFLIQSDDSRHVTILEGNKSAVALYIKHFLDRESEYEPFKVFKGHLNYKSFWQW